MYNALLFPGIFGNLFSSFHSTLLRNYICFFLLDSLNVSHVGTAWGTRAAHLHRENVHHLLIHFLQRIPTSTDIAVNEK